MTDLKRPKNRSENRRIQTILVDDHAIFLEGLTAVLRRSLQLRLDIAASFDTAAKALEWISSHPTDLLILDLFLSDSDGLSMIRQLRRADNPLCIIVLSASCEPDKVQSVLDAGANAYLLKSESPENLIKAIELALGGINWTTNVDLRATAANEKTPWQDFIQKYNLTKREIEVLALIAGGLSNKAIARQLFISDQTVGVHRKHILKKLKAPNTAALVRLAIENQVI